MTLHTYIYIYVYIFITHSPRPNFFLTYTQHINRQPHHGAPYLHVTDDTKARDFTEMDVVSEPKKILWVNIGPLCVRFTLPRVTLVGASGHQLDIHRRRAVGYATFNRRRSALVMLRAADGHLVGAQSLVAWVSSQSAANQSSPATKDLGVWRLASISEKALMTHVRCPLLRQLYVLTVAM